MGMTLHDPLCIQDTFVEGVGDIQTVGECVRFTLYANHNGDRVVVAKIVWPALALAEQANRRVKQFFDQMRH